LSLGFILLFVLLVVVVVVLLLLRFLLLLLLHTSLLPFLSPDRQLSHRQIPSHVCAVCGIFEC
jgi:hypothetical protein